MQLPVYADSEDKQYTDVLEDLQLDPAFNESDYDNKLLHPNTELIQIAEDKGAHLFIYLHVVGSINNYEKVILDTSTEFTKIDYRSYELMLVSQFDGFYKYLVKDFIAPNTSTHLYSISRLDYPVNKSVQDTQQVTYDYLPVEQIWTVHKDGDNIEYSYEYLKTITIEEKYVGSHNDGVTNSIGQYISWTDTFYIAFSTNLFMENLVEAQIEYVTNIAGPLGKIISKGDPTKPTNVVISSDQVSNFANDTSYTSGPWWFRVSWKSGIEKRTFKSISKPADFKANTGITIPKRKDESEYDWVVTFYNDPQTFSGLGSKVSSWPVPADTTILRLKYETDGVCYNLGVLDNRTSYIPPKPEESLWQKFMHWVKKIMAWLFNVDATSIPDWLAIGFLIVLAVVLIILTIFITPFLPFIASGLWSVLKAIGMFLLWLLKGLWWLVSAPFRLLFRLFSGGD